MPLPWEENLDPSVFLASYVAKAVVRHLVELDTDLSRSAAVVMSNVSVEVKASLYVCMESR
jgi:hypothetical protein